MHRLPLFTSCVLVVAAFCFAQQPSDPGKSGNSGTSNPAARGEAGQSPSSPNSSKQGSAKTGSTQRDESGQNSSGKSSVGQDVDDDSDAEGSSSRDTRTNISPPPDDEKNHPNSKSAVGDLEPKSAPDASDVQEFHPWNPMKSMKDVEVGDYYFKRKNYKAALDRYKEALFYKNNDAIATYRLAVCQEKLGDKAEARRNFEQYLKILPEGPMAKDARASLEKLGKGGPANQQ